MAGPGSASCLQHGWGQENPTQTAPGEALTTRHRTGVQFPPSPPHRASGQENPGLRTGVLFASAAFPCLMDFSLRGYAGSCPSRREKVHVRSPLRPHHVHNTDKARAHAFKFAPHRTGGPLRHFFLRVMPAGHEAEVRPPLLGPRSLLVAAHCADEVDPHRPLACAVGSGLDQPRGRVVQDLTQLRFAHPLREAMALCHLHGYIEGYCRVTSANHQLQRYGRPPNQELEQMAARGSGCQRHAGSGRAEAKDQVAGDIQCCCHEPCLAQQADGGRGPRTESREAAGQARGQRGLPVRSEPQLCGSAVRQPDDEAPHHVHHQGGPRPMQGLTALRGPDTAPGTMVGEPAVDAKAQERTSDAE